MEDENKEKVQEEVSKTDETLQKMDEKLEDIQAANERLEQNIVRLKEAEITKVIEGTADVNIPKKEETAKEYAERVMRGEGND